MDVRLHKRAVLHLLGIPHYVGKTADVVSGDVMRLLQPLPHQPLPHQPKSAATPAPALVEAVLPSTQLLNGTANKVNTRDVLPHMEVDQSAETRRESQQVIAQSRIIFADLQPFTLVAACFAHCVLLSNQAEVDADAVLWQKMLQAMGAHKMHNISWPLVSQAGWQHADMVQAAIDGFFYQITKAGKIPAYLLGRGVKHQGVAEIIAAKTQVMPSLGLLANDVNAKKSLWHTIKPPAGK